MFVLQIYNAPCLDDSCEAALRNTKQFGPATAQLLRNSLNSSESGESADGRPKQPRRQLSDAATKGPETSGSSGVGLLGRWGAQLASGRAPVG